MNTLRDLMRLDVEPTYYNRFVVFEIEIEKYLRDLGKNDFIHSTAIENILNQICTIRSCLTSADAFYLLCAVYLHDIGRKEQDIGHECISANKIKTDYRCFHLNNKFEAQIVSEICRAHAKENAVPIQSLTENFPLGSTGTNIHIRFLGALLRLADELDNTYERVEYLINENNSIRHRIAGISVNHRNNQIVINSSPETQREYVLLQLLQQQCQKVLNEVNPILKKKSIHLERILLQPAEFRLITKRTEDSPIKADWNKVFETLQNKKIKGIQTIDTIFSPDHLQDEVFRIQLLINTHCIRHEYSLLEQNNRQGIKRNTVLDLNQTESSYGIYTTEAKNKLSQLCFSPTKSNFLSNEEANDLLGKKREAIDRWAENIDKKIHYFILGNSTDADALELDFRNFPMRWASGGVYPVVKIKDKIYTAFFFRDIPPYGWNIPLGASSNDSELINPVKLLRREFLEEFLVLTNEPEISRTNEYRVLEIRESSKQKNPLDIIVPKKEAEKFIEDHLKMRKKYDKLKLRPTKDPLVFTIRETNTALTIDGKTIRNILFAINPFELGIEIVQVLECTLSENDYLLDGETLEPFGDSEKQLVRMPLALISHDYLRRNAENNFKNLKYNSSYSIQRSIIGDEFQKDEILVFNWDTNRRHYILKSPQEGKGTVDILKENDRYPRWKNMFGNYFPDTGLLKTIADGKIKFPSFFTPSSAKITCYYFDLIK